MNSSKSATTISAPRELNKERVDLEPIVGKAREYRQAMKSLEEARNILETEKDPDMIALADADVAGIEPEDRVT